MKTWKIEMMVVTIILLLVNLLFNRLFSIEILSALAVILTFGHAQISTRLSEQQSLVEQPSVECHRKLILYYIGKEVCWFWYFLISGSYSALVGVVVFLMYPLWRKYYKS